MPKLTQKDKDKIVYIAVAQLAKRISSFDSDEELAMETDQFGDLEFTQKEVSTVFVQTNAKLQEHNHNDD